MESLVNFFKGLLVFLALGLNYSSAFVSGSSDPSVQMVKLSESTASALITIEQAPPAFIPSPTPLSSPLVQTTSEPQEPQPDEEHYVLEPVQDQEGFYYLKNTPSEAMATADEVNQAVNAYRGTHNLNTLSIDNQLCDIAKVRATEAKQEFSHDKFAQHIENGDYDFTGFQMIGENLWQGSLSGVHIVEFGWDRSPGHRANLQGDWTRGCAGIDDTTVAFIFAR